MFATTNSTIRQRKEKKSLFHRKVDYQPTDGEIQNLPCLKITIINSPSRRQDEDRQRIAQPLQWKRLEVSRLHCNEEPLAVPRDLQQVARRDIESYGPIFQEESVREQRPIYEQRGGPIYEQRDHQIRSTDDYFANSRRQDEYRSSYEPQSAVPQGLQQPPRQQRPPTRPKPVERPRSAHLRSLGARLPPPVRGNRTAPSHRDAPRPKIGVRPRFQVQRSANRFPARPSAQTREVPISVQRTYRSQPHPQNYYADRQQEIRPRQSLFSDPSGRRFDRAPAVPFRGAAVAQMSRRYDGPPHPTAQQMVRREMPRSPYVGASTTTKTSPPRDHQTSARLGELPEATNRDDDGELEEGEVREDHANDEDDGEEPVFEYLDDDDEQDELDFIDADPYTLNFI